MNSTRVKPGPKSALDKNLVLWEHEWYWVFHFLVYGIPERKGTQDVFELAPPPKRLGVPEALYRERVRNWNQKTLRPGGWVRVKNPYAIDGKPGEPDVWNRLKNARTVAQVRSACRASRMWLNPVKSGKPWVIELRTKASEFLTGMSYRYPQSDRSSSERKRIVHFARAMAGTMAGISPSRAIDLLRNMKHGMTCQCVSCSVKRAENLERLISGH